MSSGTGIAGDHTVTNIVLAVAGLALLLAVLALGPSVRKAGALAARWWGMNEHRAYIAGLYADAAAMVVCSGALLAMVAATHQP